MLDRAANPPDRHARHRARRRERKARYRQAQREGRITVPVTLDGVGVDWLIREARALAEVDAGNRAEIGAAISRMISVSARK
jgi:hypothetical protein